MTRFVDQYLPPQIPGYPCRSSPRWSTSIVQVDSGAEQANQRWESPLWTFNLPEGVRSQEHFEKLRDHWLMMRGPAHTWPFRDPLDFASEPLPKPNVAPASLTASQIIGTGDGVTTRFQLVKTYGTGPQAYTRKITLPVTASVVLTVNGVAPGSLPAPLTFTVSRPGGIVEFSAPPLIGRTIRAGFLFDVPVRFQDDATLDGIVRTYGVSGFADIPLVEVRPC